MDKAGYGNTWKLSGHTVKESDGTFPDCRKQIRFEKDGTDWNRSRCNDNQYALCDSQSEKKKEKQEEIMKASALWQKLF